MTPSHQPMSDRIDGSAPATIHTLRGLRAELGASTAVIASSERQIGLAELTQEFAFRLRMVEALEIDHDAAQKQLRNFWLEVRMSNLAMAARLPASEASTKLLRDRLHTDRRTISTE